MHNAALKQASLLVAGGIAATVLTACVTPPAAVPATEPVKPAPPVARVTPEPVKAPEPPPSVFPRTAVLEDYVERVKRRIRANMKFPPAEPKSRPDTKPQQRPKPLPPDINYETMFQIGLHPDMRIHSVRIVRSSGNKRYDAAAKRAIEKAGSYPPLPEGLDFSLFASHKIRYKLHDTP